MEILELSHTELEQVSGGKFGDYTFSCCNITAFGFELSYEVFSYSGNYDGANSTYGFNRISAYNRL
ncbi:hypothetical protein [Alteromonas ponticola]|uniref:Bacteriocin n=1 Tax=Alteromonas ponticola TaxID=2720613 RepID=A0ABX1R3R3_9ALTE|nr:hypothetical protein [Alteromonas ponticola]NMH59845.1 hypothetical protein [Alteromonas ponticola]